MVSTWARKKFANTRRELLAAIRFGRLQQGPRTPRVLRAGGAWQERAGGQARPQALGCWVSARESDSRARGATALLTASGSSRCFQGSLHHHFTAEVSPCPRWGRQDTARRPKGCGQRTFRWRCRQAKARDASISRWCCGPRHLKPGCLRVPGS